MTWATLSGVAIVMVVTVGIGYSIHSQLYHSMWNSYDAGCLAKVRSEFCASKNMQVVTKVRFAGRARIPYNNIECEGPSGESLIPDTVIEPCYGGMELYLKNSQAEKGEIK